MKRIDWRGLLAAVVLAAGGMAGAETTAEDAHAAVDEASAEAVSVRDDLVGRLESRPPAATYELRLTEGADHAEAHLRLYRIDDEWSVSYGVVPLWRQESFHEKFKYRHRGQTYAVLRDKQRYPCTPGGLEPTENGGLAGDMSVAWKLDETREQRFPPGTPVRWPQSGEVFTHIELNHPMMHEKVRVQHYSVDVDVSEDVLEFDVVLHGGVNGRDVHARFAVPAQPHYRQHVRTYTWNGGIHSADVSGLSVEDGRLRGELKIRLNPDRWFPGDPQHVTYEMDCTLVGGSVVGRFDADGTLGEYVGTVSGEAGRRLTGTYRATGEMGEYVSLIEGRVMDPVVPSQVLAALGGTGGEDRPTDLAARAAQLSELMHDIRALRLAIERYPLRLDDALSQTAFAAPIWPEGDDSDWTADEIADLADYAAGCLRLVRTAAGPAPSPTVGAPQPADRAFGAFYEPVDLTERPDGAFELPADSPADRQAWGFVPVWEVIGPLPNADNLDNNFAPLPEVAPGSKAALPAELNVLPRHAREAAADGIRWSRIEAPRGRIEPSWSREPGRGTHYGSVWYARAVIFSDEQREVTLSLSARDHGKLWVNGRLVWIGQEMKWRWWDSRDGLVTVRLDEGENDLLLRVREDRYRTWARLRVHLGGEAAEDKSVPEAIPPQVTGPRGDGSGRFADVRPPAVWDLNTGMNVAWTRELDVPVRGPLTAVGDRLLFSAAPDTLVCLSQRDGGELWRAKSSVFELADEATRQAWTECTDQERREEFFRRHGLRYDARPVAPLSDGEHIWSVYPTGVAACHTMDGQRKWLAETGLTSVGMRVINGVVVLEGTTGARNAPGIVMGLDAATGERLWSRELGDGGGPVHAVTLRRGELSRDVVVASSLAVLDAHTGETLLSDLDADPSAGSGVYAAGNRIFYGKLTRLVAAELVLNSHGEVGSRFLWRTHYAHKYDRAVATIASDRYLMVSGTVPEDCKGHSNAARRELHVYDVATGRPVRRIMPVLDRAQQDHIPSTVAGPYVFVQDSGGGHAGGHPERGEMAVVRIDGYPKVISRNLLTLGTSTPPTFADDRMFLVHGRTLTCVADDGTGRSDEAIAAEILEEIGPKPSGGDYLTAEPLAGPAKKGFAEAALIPEEGLGVWLAAGPLPASGQLPADLPAAAGDSVTVDGVTRRFEPVEPAAVNTTYTYGSSYYLSGMGNTVAQVVRGVDTAAIAQARTDQSILLHCVLNNSRRRVLTLMAPATGIEYRLGGQPLRAYDTVDLPAGRFPLTLRVGPDFLSEGRQLQVSFSEKDRPDKALRGWLAGADRYAEELVWIASSVEDPELRDRAGELLDMLDDYRAHLDASAAVRSAGLDGSNSYTDARPPRRWERTHNLLWSAAAATAPGTLPVAAGDAVWLSTSAGGLQCRALDDGGLRWSRQVGPGLSSPAVDASRVYVADADGVVHAFGRGGRPLWRRALEADSTPSLLAAGARLIVSAGDAVQGLDPESGAVLWTAGSAAEPTPILTRVGNVRLVVTASGQVLSAETGELLAETPPAGAVSLGAARLGNWLVFADGTKLRAVRLPASVDGPFAAEVGWTAEVGPLSCRPVAAGGKLVVAVEGEGLMATSEDGDVLHRVDARPVEGAVLASAGSQVHVVRSADGLVTVHDTGSSLEEVWRYRLVVDDGALPAIAFVGRTAVLAGARLHAVGGTEPAEPEPLEQATAVEVESGFEPAESVPAAPFVSNVMPPEWLVAGPFTPKELENDFLTDLGGRGMARPDVGTVVSHAGREVVFRPLGDDGVWRHPRFTAGFDSIDVSEAMDRTWDTAAYFYTVINNDAPRYVDWTLLSPGGESWNPPDRIKARLWVGRTELVEGRIYRLPEGKLPVLIQTELGRLEGHGRIWIAPRMGDRTAEYQVRAERHEVAEETWKEFLDTVEDVFELD